MAEVVFSEFSTGGGVTFCKNQTDRDSVNNKEPIERDEEHMMIIPTRERVIKACAVGF